MQNNYHYPRNALEEAIKTANGWQDLEGQLDVPSLDMKDFSRLIGKAKDLVDKAEELRMERSQVVAERNKVLRKVWDYTKRIRNAVKATFGDNSPNVQALGIHPASRKRK